MKNPLISLEWESSQPISELIKSQVMPKGVKLIVIDAVTLKVLRVVCTVITLHTHVRIQIPANLF